MCVETLRIILLLHRLHISTAPRGLYGVVCVLFESNHDFAGPSVTGFSIHPLRYACTSAKCALLCKYVPVQVCLGAQAAENEGCACIHVGAAERRGGRR